MDAVNLLPSVAILLCFLFHCALILLPWRPPCWKASPPLPVHWILKVRDDFQKAPSLGFSRFWVILQGPGCCIFKVFNHLPRPRACIPKAFQLFSKGPRLGLLKLSIICQGPGPWISKVFCYFIWVVLVLGPQVTGRRSSGD